MSALLPPPLAPKPRGPVARTGWPLYIWIRMQKTLTPFSESRIHAVVSADRLYYHGRLVQSLVAAEILARFVRRNPQKFTVADAEDLEYVFRNRYAPRSRRHLVRREYFGTLVSDGIDVCGQHCVWAQPQWRSFYVWLQRAKDSRLWRQIPQQTRTAMVLLQQTKITISHKERSAWQPN